MSRTNIATAARPREFIAPVPAVGPAPAPPLRFGPLAVTELTEDSFPPPLTGPTWVYVTLNAEIALELPENAGLRHLHRSERLRVSIDGQWLLWAMHRKYPRQELHKLSGSDLIHRLAAHCAQHGKRLLLLGSTDLRNARAVRRLRGQAPELKVRGAALPWYQPGTPSEARAVEAAWEQLRAFRPHYVVLGLGATKEHRLAAQLAPRLDGWGTGLLCFGGAIDLASGQVPRAPRWMQRWGLEGPWRVWMQPGRAWRFVRVLRILPALMSGRY